MDHRCDVHACVAVRDATDVPLDLLQRPDGIVVLIEHSEGDCCVNPGAQHIGEVVV